jgi:very-short-patch-repair endonuclease
MQEITKKLRDNAAKELMPTMIQLESEGMEYGKIIGVVGKIIDSKIQAYYRRIPVRFDKIVKTLDFKPDSKAEAVFYGMLLSRGINFKFHFPIGPYTADYLFKDYLVFELDGAKHDEDHDAKRDKYLRRMGYKVMRVPIWILAMNPNAVIDEISEQIK